MKISYLLPFSIACLSLVSCGTVEVPGNRNYTLYGESGGKQVIVDVSIKLKATGIGGLDDFDSILSQYDDKIQSKLNLSLASMPVYANSNLLEEGATGMINTTLATLDKKILDKLVIESVDVTYADFTKDGAQRSLQAFMADFPGMYSGGSCDGTDGGGEKAPDGDITCTLALTNPLPGQKQFVKGSFDVKGTGGKLDTDSAEITPQFAQPK
jgi:hypothetical protein